MDYRDKILDELRSEVDSKLDAQTKRCIEQYVQGEVESVDHCLYSADIHNHVAKKEYGHAVAGMYLELMVDIDRAHYLRGEWDWETLTLTKPQVRKVVDFERTKSKLLGYIRTAYKKSSELQSRGIEPTGNKNKEIGLRIGREAYDVPDFLTKSEFECFESAIQKAQKWYEYSFYETIFSEDYFLAPIKDRGGKVKDAWNEDGIPNLIKLLAAAGLNNNRISYYLAQAAHICGFTRVKKNNPKERMPIKQGAMNKRVAAYFKTKPRP